MEETYMRDSLKSMKDKLCVTTIIDNGNHLLRVFIICDNHLHSLRCYFKSKQQLYYFFSLTDKDTEGKIIPVHDSDFTLVIQILTLHPSHARVYMCTYIFTNEL